MTALAAFSFLVFFFFFSFSAESALLFFFFLSFLALGFLLASSSSSPSAALFRASSGDLCLLSLRSSSPSLLSRCLDSSLERDRDLSLPLLLNGLGLRSPSLPLLLNGLGLRLDDRGGGGGATLLGRPPSSKYLPGGEPPGDRERSLLY